MLPPVAGRAGSLPSLTRTPPPFRPAALASPTGAASAMSLAAPPPPLSSSLSPALSPAASASLEGDGPSSPTPPQLQQASFSSSGSRMGTALRPSSATQRRPLPAMAVAGSSGSTAASLAPAWAAHGGGGGGSGAHSGTSAPLAGAAAGAAAVGAGPGREAYERAVACRKEQAKLYVLKGLPVLAACCALSVDDPDAAVGLLLRGHMEELAVALALALRPAPVQLQPQPQYGSGGGYALQGGLGDLPGGMAALTLYAGGPGPLASRSRALLTLAAKCEAGGDAPTAAELLRAAGARGEQLAQLACRCRGAVPEAQLAALYRSLGLADPASYGPAAERALAQPLPGPDPWDTVRALLLANRQEAGADRALAGVRRMLQEGGRPRVHAGQPQWDGAWLAINSLWPAALPRAVWQDVFAAAVYLGCCAAWEQGYVAVGLYLARVLMSWCSTGVTPPVPQQRLTEEVAEALDVLVAQQGPDARDMLQELLATAYLGNTWIQDLLRGRLARLSMATGGPPAGRVSRAGGGSGSGGDGPPSPSRVPAGLAAASGSLSRRAAGSGIDLCGATSGPGGPGALRGALLLAPALAPQQPAAASGDSGSSSPLGATPAPPRRVSSPGPLSLSAIPAAAAAATAPSPPWAPAFLQDLARGPVVVAGARMPSRPPSGALVTSVVSGAAIRGPVMQLDDGVSYVSLSEAVMLARVMRYSPLGSGKLLRVL